MTGPASAAGSGGRVRVGLVGAGPWARILHAPLLTSGPETELVGVWARRPEAAAELAAKHNATTYERYEAMLDDVDAVAFAVPPDVQATMGIEAARAGKHLLLEKPVAMNIEQARRLADAVDEAGVASMMVLTWRYSPRIREFIDEARALEPTGGRAWFLSGALLGGWFATPWRLEKGALLDLGPHVLDLLDAVLGPVVEVKASGDSLKWVGLLLSHESGATSVASLSATIHVDAQRRGCEVFSQAGVATADLDGVSGEIVPVLRTEFAALCADPKPNPLDVHRGVQLQQILDTAAAQL